MDATQEISVNPTLLRRITPRGTRTHKGLFRCMCGNEFVASLNNVARGHTQSCGCLADEMRGLPYPRHGHFLNGRPSPTYKSWQSMIARCENPRHPKYHLYGGRGITICPRWRSDFAAFLHDMGERPKGLTLDRKNGNLGYDPENCRWATYLVQRLNRRALAAGVVLFALLLPIKSRAHDAAHLSDWINEQQWRNKQGSYCCGADDCHIEPAQHVSHPGAGWLLKDNKFVPEQETLPSPDGQIWVCRVPHTYHNYTLADPAGGAIPGTGDVRCVFTPTETY